MNVTNLEVGFPNGGYYEFGRPVPFQIALATEGGGRTLSVPMTGAFRGLYQSVNGEMRLLLEYSGELWCEARVTWSPANLLAPAGNPGPFENLDGLLTATGTASGTPGDTGSLTIEILSTNLVTGGVEAIETATHSLQISELEIGIQGQFVESAAIDVGDTVAPRRFVRTRYEPVVVFFDPSQPLAGKMDIREPSAQTCNLTDVVQPPGAAAAPVALAYSWAQPLGSLSAARFEVPRIVRLTNSSEVQFGSGGAAFVHGRRPGALTLNTMPSLVDADNYDLPTGPSRDDAYTVNPVTLTATFVPAPGDDRDGKLLFERHIEGREVDAIVARQPTTWPKRRIGDELMPVVEPTIRTAAIDRAGRIWMALVSGHTYVFDRDGDKIRTVQFRGAGLIAPDSFFFTKSGRLLVTPGLYEFDLQQAGGPGRQ